MQHKPCDIQIYIKKTKSYETQMTVLQVTSFGFNHKPSSEIFLHQKMSSGNWSLHMRFRSHSFTTHVIKFNAAHAQNLMKEMYKMRIKVWSIESRALDKEKSLMLAY